MSNMVEPIWVVLLFVVRVSNKDLAHAKWVLCHRWAFQPIFILWFRKLIFFLEKTQTYINGDHYIVLTRPV